MEILKELPFIWSNLFFNINEGDDYCDDGDEDGGGKRIRWL